MHQSEILLPKRPRVVFEKENKGVYEIDALYAGYGYTIGNSLRRVILSSLPGAAITMVKIDGINHEFSTIEGIKEDIITILLNLKQVRFRLHGNEAQKAILFVKGSKTSKTKEVKAADFKVPTQLEILNKDQHIATITSAKAELKLEATVEKGLGYVPKEVLKEGKLEIGTMMLDAIFTPIRKVNYEVENMRIGERTDYNKLRFHIETDGSITPREALEKSIELLIKQLSAIVGFSEKEAEQIIKGARKKAEEKKEAVAKEKETLKETKKSGSGLLGKEEQIEKTASEEKKKEESEKKESAGEDDILKTRIEDLELSNRTFNALSNARIRTLGGLARKSENDLLEIKGLGKKGIVEIRRALGNFGLLLK
jgi:DNA-directed RNA polymerase subunit alpha